MTLIGKPEVRRSGTGKAGSNREWDAGDAEIGTRNKEAEK